MCDEQELLERWRGWQRSIEERDREAAQEYLDDDYALELVQPTPANVARAEWLDTLSEYVVSSYTVEEQIVDVVGELGLVLHRAGLRLRGRPRRHLRTHRRLATRRRYLAGLAPPLDAPLGRSDAENRGCRGRVSDQWDATEIMVVRLDGLA